MNQPNKFKIKKPRITLSDEQKNQARAGMAGEAVKASAEGETLEAVEDPATPVETPPALSERVEQPELAVLPSPLPIAQVHVPTPEELIEEIAEFTPTRKGRGSKGKKEEKNKATDSEDAETHIVRISKDSVLNAKMNILLLPRNYGIKNLRDYGDAAFAFYEAHLRKTGKLPQMK